MVQRVGVFSKGCDARAEIRKNRLEMNGFRGKVSGISIVDVYTIDASLDDSQIKLVSSMLANPVTQKALVNQSFGFQDFDWAIETGYLPGVRDNVASTAVEGIEDLLGKKLDSEDGVYTSQITFLSGNLSKDEAVQIAESLANPLIQKIQIKNRQEFEEQNGMDVIVPKVKLKVQSTAKIVDILNAGDDELAVIGKKGIKNEDGSRRGPLALSLTYMKTIQDYFRKQNRNPTDVELESIAQTWSEHCKHTIFADPMDELKEGLYKTYIKGSTNLIRKQKGENDFCVSVFTDNSGAIIFDDHYLISDKAETHNSPSALDPFGEPLQGLSG
jgi:phosphoribosylformylglycinamidine synthase